MHWGQHRRRATAGSIRGDHLTDMQVAARGGGGDTRQRSGCAGREDQTPNLSGERIRSSLPRHMSAGCSRQLSTLQFVDVIKGSVYLPRIDFPIWAGPPGTALPSEEELANRLTDSEGQRRNSAAGLPSLTCIFRQMSFRHGVERAAFHLTLFGLFPFGIPVPPDLPVEWNRYDYRDFSGGRM